VAMNAQKFDKAAEIAEQYIARKPGDWQGYHFLGRAYLRLGRYEDARKALQKAIALKPGEAAVAVVLSLSESYSIPARRTLEKFEKFRRIEKLRDPGRRESPPPMEHLDEAARQLEESVEVLRATERLLPDALDITQRIGLDYHAISVAKEFKFERLEKAAKAAEASRLYASAKKNRKDNEKARSDKEKSLLRGICGWIPSEDIHKDMFCNCLHPRKVGQNLGPALRYVCALALLRPPASLALRRCSLVKEGGGRGAFPDRHSRRRILFLEGTLRYGPTASSVYPGGLRHRSSTSPPTDSPEEPL